jgi:hypothetical protein
MGILCGGDGEGPDPNDIGVAPGATFIAAKALDQNGVGSYSTLSDCLDWMADVGRPNVLNNSWGNDRIPSDDYWTHVLNLKELGIITVFAIGNTGPNPRTSIAPGSYPIVVSAGATDEGDNIASFSSRGPAPDQWPWNDQDNWPRADWDSVNPSVVAPGVDILSAITSGGYGTESGTSMSCPEVAGCAALMLQRNPNLTPVAVFNYVTNTTDQVTNGGNTWPNNNYGWGRLNCLKALKVTPAAIAQSDIANATGPSQGKHIVRNPQTNALHVVWQNSTSIYYQSSTDGGNTWSSPLSIASGSDPCISLDFNGAPWVTYRSGSAVYTAMQRATGEWHSWLNFNDVSVLVGPPSMVCSNWENGGGGGPPPLSNPPDMGYAVFVVYPCGGGLEINHEGLIFVPFDTIHQDLPLDTWYCYDAMQIYQPQGGWVDSMPCISRTPDDYLHVTWKSGTQSGGQAWNQVYYEASSLTTPGLIRQADFPTWSLPYQLSDNQTPCSTPCNDAYSGFVSADWRFGNPGDLGVIDARNRDVSQAPNQWGSVVAWSDQDYESDQPVLVGNAGVWRQEFDYPNDTGNIACRFPEDADPLRVTYSPNDETYPQADLQRGSTSSQNPVSDTMRVLFTELQPSGGYAIMFCSFAHSASQFLMRDHAGQPGGSQEQTTSEVTPGLLRVACAPNLITTGTSISYVLRAPARISIRIVDLSVRTVRTVETPGSVKKPGSYSFTWNACNDRGEPIPEGVYFCQLDAGPQRSTAKLVVAR